MKLCVFVLASSLLSACAVHFHFHDSRPPTEVQTVAAPHAAAAPATSAASATQHTTHGRSTHADHNVNSPDDRQSVAGVVVDPEGNPIRARIAAVGSNGGSIATTTDDRGRFSIDTPSDDFVLHASTDDALIALERPTHALHGIELKLRPGGMLVIDLEGREATRCAIFAQHLRAEDFTLRAGSTCRVAVPSGGVRVRLYQGDEVFEERNFDIRVGESRTASFKLDS